MMNSRKTLLAAAFAVGLAVLPASTVAAGPIYDVVADFSFTLNPNGVWQYGFVSPVTGSFVAGSPVTAHRGFVNLDGWNNPTGTYLTPYVVKDHGANSINIFGFMLPTDVIDLHPDNGAGYAVVRWTAPADSTWRVQGQFDGLDYVNARGGVTAVAILYDGTSIAGTTISHAGQGSDFSFDFVQAVAAGQVLDFAVGNGDRSYEGDSTGLRLTITAVPEPASMLLLGTGLAGLARVARRRR